MEAGIGSPPLRKVFSLAARIRVSAPGRAIPRAASTTLLGGASGLKRPVRRRASQQSGHGRGVFARRIRLPQNRHGDVGEFMLSPLLQDPANPGSARVDLSCSADRPQIDRRALARGTDPGRMGRGPTRNLSRNLKADSMCPVCLARLQGGRRNTCTGNVIRMVEPSGEVGLVSHGVQGVAGSNPAVPTI